MIVEGFAFRSKTTADGERQVLSLHIPGDIPDLRSLHLGIMDHDLVSLSPCTLGFISQTRADGSDGTTPAPGRCLVARDADRWFYLPRMDRECRAAARAAANGSPVDGSARAASSNRAHSGGGRV
ncbi:hypothetical protein [Bradyrhizobium sp. USDA 3650]